MSYRKKFVPLQVEIKVRKTQTMKCNSYIMIAYPTIRLIGKVAPANGTACSRVSASEDLIV